MKNKHLMIQDRFSPVARELRGHFEQRFAEPRETSSARFVWDFWHVPDQYTLHRTPAYHYFPKKLYMSFHRHLVDWGRRQLGCWDISPPWLSYYTEGCRQELHSDVPHGPWAYVFSLTPPKKIFTGGETLILKPETLNYWKIFAAQTDREHASFVDRIPPQFNRLTVFDPRFPHGVTEVRGTQDPREARLVIHGWFTEPKTYINGYLPRVSTEKRLNQAFDQLQQLLPQFPLVQGTLSLQLDVAPGGKTLRAGYLTNTLVCVEDVDRDRVVRELSRAILGLYRALQFQRSRGPTTMTIPLIFQ